MKSLFASIISVYQGSRCNAFNAMRSLTQYKFWLGVMRMGSLFLSSFCELGFRDGPLCSHIYISLQWGLYEEQWDQSHCKKTLIFILSMLLCSYFRCFLYSYFPYFYTFHTLNTFILAYFRYFYTFHILNTLILNTLILLTFWYPSSRIVMFSLLPMRIKSWYFSGSWKICCIIIILCYQRMQWLRNNLVTCKHITQVIFSSVISASCFKYQFLNIHKQNVPSFEMPNFPLLTCTYSYKL